MSHTQLLLYLFGISAVFFNHVEARLEGEGIIGGDNATDGQFPYQISLEVEGQSICGGSILAERFVITAAHCVNNEDGSFMGHPLKVVAGITEFMSYGWVTNLIETLRSLFGLKNKSNRVAVDVVQVFVPREYRATSGVLYGDIAILKLNGDLGLTRNSQLGRVELPTTNETYEGKKAIISGFGFNYIEVVTDKKGEREAVNGKSYGKMRFAVANVLSKDQCKAFYWSNRITSKHICAAIVQRDEGQPEGVCGGDSGGPLVYQGVQIGVLSAGPLECEENILPAVYTRVSDYLDFINKAVGGRIDDSIRSTTLSVPSTWWG